MQAMTLEVERYKGSGDHSDAQRKRCVCARSARAEPSLPLRGDQPASQCVARLDRSQNLAPAPGATGRHRGRRCEIRAEGRSCTRDHGRGAPGSAFARRAVDARTVYAVAHCTKRGAQVKRGVFGMLSALNCVLPAGVVSAETVSDENIIMCLGMFMRDVVMPALYLVRARAPVLCMRLRWAGLRGIVGLRAAVTVCINLRPGARRHRGPRQPPCGCRSGYCRWQQ